ncbi:MAG: hypothetical protein JWL88_670 [Parcubacteria group bacterium]|nr:hypothetical protein [Parcubacteria group bacterium]
MKSSNSSIDEQKIRDLLIEVGLTDTEAYLYIAGLAQETITVQELGAATGIKRPTIYHALQTLAEKGLVTERERDGKSAFRMEAPGKLFGWIEQQKEALVQKEDAVQSLMSQLAARTPVEGGELQSTHYTDMKSVQAVFDLAFYARSKKCTIILPSKEYMKELDLAGRSRDAEHRGFTVQTIVREGIGSALLAYDDTVVLISISPLSATVIVSAPLAAILSNLF